MTYASHDINNKIGNRIGKRAQSIPDEMALKQMIRERAAKLLPRL
jgi:hypothetical protein